MTLRCIENSLKANPNLNCLSQKELDLSTCFQFITNLTDYLTLSNNDFFSKFCSYFDKIIDLSNLAKVIQTLLEFFKVNEDMTRVDMESYDDDFMETDTNLLRITSELTIDSVIANFRDLVYKRFDFFKNLCVFLNIINKYSNKVFKYTFIFIIRIFIRYKIFVSILGKILYYFVIFLNFFTTLDRHVNFLI